MLVSTTVIEVGVDVPNATVMVVLDADRFGVSQLHQLRGRIGRGGHAGLCLLVTGAAAGRPRWSGWRRSPATRDGFALSAVDLDQRREGDVLGTEQSGAALDAQAAVGARRRGHDRAAPGLWPRSCVEEDPELADHDDLAPPRPRLQDQADFLEKT